jgi:hypothetical protein
LIWTVVDGVKFVPLIVRLPPAPATRLDGVIDVAVRIGFVIVKGNEAEEPFNASLIETLAIPAVAIFAAGTVAVIVSAAIDVGVKVALFQLISTVFVSYPDALMTSVNAGVPAIFVEGEIDAIVGGASSGRVCVALDAVCAGTNDATIKPTDTIAATILFVFMFPPDHTVAIIAST